MYCCAAFLQACSTVSMGSWQAYSTGCCATLMLPTVRLSLLRFCKREAEWMSPQLFWNSWGTLWHRVFDSSARRNKRVRSPHSCASRLSCRDVCLWDSFGAGGGPAQALWLHAPCGPRLALRTVRLQSQVWSRTSRHRPIGLVLPLRRLSCGAPLRPRHSKHQTRRDSHDFFLVAMRLVARRVHVNTVAGKDAD